MTVLVATQAAGRLHVWPQNPGGDSPGYFERATAWLTSTVPSELDTSALLVAAIGLAGTFVAVYFATVSFVVSTSYKDATKRLRSHVVRQPETRWYVSFFTQAVAYTVLALALPTVGRELTYLTLAAAGVAAMLVVLSFGRIWVTLFMLLEPTSLFPQIQRSLNRWITRAYKLGLQRSPSAIGVRRANEHIREDLATLDDLVTLILDREYERSRGRGIAASYDSRVGVALMSLLRVWQNYAGRKHAIGTLQGWSPTRKQSKDWFLAAHSEVGIALATGTTLVGSDVVDDLWFERSLADAVERLLADRSLRSVERAMAGLPPLSRLLGGLGQFEEARLWIAATTFVPMTTVSAYAAERALASPVSVGGPATVRPMSREAHFALPDEASAHNLVDGVMMEALSACLGYVDYFAYMADLLPGVATVVVDRKRKLRAGRLVLQITENLRDALSAEVRIEGQRVTPDSAITQLVARGLATEVVDQLDEFIAYLENELWPWVVIVGRSRSWIAGAALSRATELSQKLESALRTAESVLAACESVHLDKDDRWPATATEELRVRAKSLGDRLELPIAQLAVAVDAAPDSDRPDHFGWAYYRAHENVLRRVLDREPGDPEEFRQKVALLYLTGDVATQRLLATVRRHDQTVINSYVAEPYVRFLQLSGIALVVSAVTGDSEPFAPFESMWVAQLADPEFATTVLARAAATLASESALFAITPGGINRSEIEIRANRALEALGVGPRRGDFDDFDGVHGAYNFTPALGPGAVRLLCQRT